MLHKRTIINKTIKYIRRATSLSSTCSDTFPCSKTIEIKNIRKAVKQLLLCHPALGLIDITAESKAQFRPQWTPLGVGVAYQSYGPGKNVLICYGGYGVTETLSRHWADRLMTHSDLKTLDIGHVYAVKGPQEPGYNSREIGNSKLVAHLLANQHPELAVVIAHSSGSFVANEFFTQLAGSDVNRNLYKKAVYYNLDGAGGPFGAGLTWLWNEYFVYAKSGSMFSMNANSMKSHGHGDQLIQLNGSGSQCQNSRCLHDFMINRHPWSPSNFDVSRDYSLFAIGEHEVQSDFIDKTVATLRQRTG